MPAFHTINTEVQAPRNLDHYFDKELYIENLTEAVEDQLNYVQLERTLNFATLLANTATFAHFMDGYIDEEIMNFDITNCILVARGYLKERYKSPRVSMKTCNLAL